MLGFLQNQRGTVAVIAAVAMVALLGFAALVVDMGLLYLNRIQLVNMVDASALAGARDLPAAPWQALNTANRFAAANGQPGDIVSPSVWEGNTRLTVNASRIVNLMFARVLGYNEQTVTAVATAAISPAGAATGIVPLGVEQQNFVYGASYTLKQGGGDGYTGNYGALAMGGTGADNYEYNIENGYKGNLKVGDTVSTETGNMVGPTDQGVRNRVSKDSGATFETVTKSSSRIIILPIVDSLQQNGRSPIKIVGFAGFFLEGAQAGVVKGKFMKLYTGNASDSSGPAQDFGLYNVRLIQ